MITLQHVEFFLLQASVLFSCISPKKGWLTFFVIGKQVSPNIGGQGLLKIGSCSVLYGGRDEM